VVVVVVDTVEQMDIPADRVAVDLQTPELVDLTLQVKETWAEQLDLVEIIIQAAAVELVQLVDLDLVA
jgi:hypothetical protein